MVIMATTRQNKYSRLIQKELSGIFAKDGNSFYGNTMVTITLVKMSPDLGIAKVYLSPFKVTDHEGFLQSVNQHKSEIRNLLGRKIGKQVRKIPELIFYVDDSLDYYEKMDKLFDKIDIPPSDKNSEPND